MASEINLRESDGESWDADMILVEEKTDQGDLTVIDLTKGPRAVLHLPPEHADQFEPGHVYEQVEIVTDGDDFVVQATSLGTAEEPKSFSFQTRNRGTEDEFVVVDGGRGFSVDIRSLEVPDLPEDQDVLNAARTALELRVVRVGERAFIFSEDTPRSELVPRIRDTAEGVRAELQAEEESAERRRRHAELDSARATYAAQRDGRFFNPFAFVSLPSDVERSEPVGHGTAQEDCYSGSIMVEWESLSPLLIRSTETEGVWRLPRSAGQIRIPGSTIKGAVRSLHEALTGGCLRVFNADFVPVYRETADTSHRKGWKLGRVEEVNRDGRPTAIRVTNEPEWVKGEQLATACDEDGVAADGIAEDGLFVINGKPASQFDRQQIANATVTRATIASDPQGKSVALLRARGDMTVRGDFWCATGTLSGRRLRLTERGWQKYLREIANTAAESSNTPTLGDLEPVYHNGTYLGLSRGARREFAPGQVVWCKESQGGISEIALSNLWRGEGRVKAGERATGHEACSDPRLLCASCQLFGSADTTDGTSDGAPQMSYRGHLRFSHAYPVDAEGNRTEEVAISEVDLATRGVPRPGAGQFYLRNRSADGSPRQASTEFVNGVRKTNPPIRNWGSEADRPTPREIAGRKFYWHGDPNVQTRPRHRARRNAEGDLVQHELQRCRAEIAATGTRWRTGIRFENLTDVQVGSILAALCPSSVLAGLDDVGPIHTETDIGLNYATHLGGGKPFGLSSVRAQLIEVSAQPARARYSNESTEPLAAEGAIEAFKDSASGRRQETWSELAAMLRVGRADPDRISYPPGRRWAPNNGTLNDNQSDEFDESFRWFKDTGGQAHANSERPIVSLPRPTDVDPSLPVASDVSAFQQEMAP